MRLTKSVFLAFLLATETLGFTASRLASTSTSKRALSTSTRSSRHTKPTAPTIKAVGLVSAASFAPEQPKRRRERLKKLAQPPVNLETWIELYHVLYPSRTVAKAKNMVKNTYASASRLKLMSKSAVKGLLSESSGHEQKKAEKVDEGPQQTFNSSSLMRKLLGKDLSDRSDSESEQEPVYDSDSDTEPCSDTYQESDDSCSSSDEDERYGWDYDYESYGQKRNVSRKASRKSFSGKRTNRTNTSSAVSGKMSPSTVLPLRSNSSNYTNYSGVSVEPQEAKASYNEDFFRWLCVCLFMIIVFD